MKTHEELIETDYLYRSLDALVRSALDENSVQMAEALKWGMVSRAYEAQGAEPDPTATKAKDHAPVGFPYEFTEDKEEQDPEEAPPLTVEPGGQEEPPATGEAAPETETSEEEPPTE